MAAQINNITLFSLCDQSDFTGEVFGLGDAAIADIGNRTGFDGTGTVFLNSFNFPVVENNVYTARTALNLTSIDISGSGQALLVHARNQIKNYDVLTTDSQSIHLYCFSGGTTANWGVWFVDNAFDNGFRSAEWFIFRAHGTPDQSGGAFDNTDITGFGVGLKSRVTSSNVSSALNIMLERAYYINEPEFTDTDATATDIDDFVDILADDGTIPTLFVKKAGATRQFAIPFNVTARNFNSLPSATGYAFNQDDLMYSTAIPALDYMKFTPIASGSQSLSNTQIVKGAGQYDLTLDTSASGSSIDFDDSLVTGAGDVVISGSSSLDMQGVTLSSPDNVSLSDALVNVTINSCANPVAIDGSLASGSTINIQTPVGDALDINISEADLSGVSITLPTSEVNMTAGTGTGSYDLTGIESAGTVTFDNETANNITIDISGDLTAAVKSPTTGGGSITLNQPVVLATGSITGIASGSRLEIINTTKLTKPVNQVINGTEYTIQYVEGSAYEEGDVIEVRLAYQSGSTAKKEFSQLAVANESGWSILAAQEDDDVYISLGIDGSTITKFTADYVNDEVDITVGADFFGSEFYAWWVYNNTTQQGIDEFFGGVTAEDEANLRINTDVVNLYFDNLTAANLKQLDNRRIYRQDGQYPVKNPTTGGGGIDIVWRNQILIATTGDGALTPLEKQQLAAASTFNPSTDTLEGDETYDEALRLIRAEAAGKVIVSGNDVIFRDKDNTKDRIVATTDSNGQRITVTVDGE